jgi:hypothetical protein
MVKHGGFLALAAVILLTPSLAHAQRGGGVVMGPNGPLYDTRTPEWKASGGNLFIYQQLMEQKMYMRQQQMLYQQQQQMLKSQKGMSTGPTQNPSVNVNLSLSKKKKKRRSYVPTGEVASKGETEKKSGTSGSGTSKVAASKSATAKAYAASNTDASTSGAGKATGKP